VNTVVSRETLEGVDHLCRDLAVANVDHWALMTEAPRGNLSGKSISAKEVFNSIEGLEAIARKCGFVGQIERWNYLTVPNSYLLAEPDGRVVIPGTTHPEDIFVGEMATIDVNRIKTVVDGIASQGQPAFFGWDHSPYFR